MKECYEGEKSMGYKIAKIKEVVFVSKQNIPWNDVEQYLKQYIGQMFVGEEYQDSIYIASTFEILKQGDTKI